MLRFLVWNTARSSNDVAFFFLNVSDPQHWETIPSLPHAWRWRNLVYQGQGCSLFGWYWLDIFVKNVVRSVCFRKMFLNKQTIIRRKSFHKLTSLGWHRGCEACTWPCKWWGHGSPYQGRRRQCPVHCYYHLCLRGGGGNSCGRFFFFFFFFFSQYNYNCLGNTWFKHQ